jgi:hypothetical protein
MMQTPTLEMTMTEKKKLFRRVFNAMIEGRRNQAQTYVERYLKDRGLDHPKS